MAKRIRYSETYIKTAIERVNSGVTQAQVAKELGIDFFSRLLSVLFHYIFIIPRVLSIFNHPNVIHTDDLPN